MANQIERRLIAAGASPQRAQQFAVQFQKAQQAKSPGKKLTQEDISGAFDSELELASRQLFPDAFRPPSVDDPQIDDYIEFLYPGQSQKIKDRAYKFSAPTLLSAKKSSIPYEKLLADLVESGTSLAKIQELIQTDYNNNNPDLTKFPALGEGGDYGAAAIKAAEKLFGEYNAAQEKLITERQNFLKKDKEYSAGIPAKGLKYGAGTNLKQGIVDIATRPGVKDFYDKTSQTFKQNYPGASQAGGIAVDVALKTANKKGLNPRQDELQRRFDIKYKK